VYARPASVFVAQFIGTPPMNIFPPGMVESSADIVGVRPEHIDLDPMSSLRGAVTLVEQLGHGDAAQIEALRVAREARELQHVLDQARQTLAKSPQPAAKPVTTPKVIVSDDFTSAKPQQWEVLKGDWKHAPTGVRQHETGAERRSLRLKPAPPADFEASLSFTIRGGQKWKSIGIAFDCMDGDDVMVYMSAFSGGPKIQVALASAGKSTYPAAGSVARPISQDVRYTLDLRVRGQLINASINGEPVNHLNELEFIEGEIFANVWGTEKIVRINPKDGNVVGVIDLTGIDAKEKRRDPQHVLNGIAYDPKTGEMFVTGKCWPKIYQIRLVPKK
jgi:hypothetical protein